MNLLQLVEEKFTRWFHKVNISKRIHCRINAITASHQNCTTKHNHFSLYTYLRKWRLAYSKCNPQIYRNLNCISKQTQHKLLAVIGYRNSYTLCDERTWITALFIYHLTHPTAHTMLQSTKLFNLFKLAIQLQLQHICNFKCLLRQYHKTHSRAFELCSFYHIICSALLPERVLYAMPNTI